MPNRKIDENRTSKQCGLCKKEKPREEFYVNRASNDGMSGMCKDCQSLYSSIRMHSKLSKEELSADLERTKRKMKRLEMFLAGKELREVVEAELV